MHNKNKFTVLSYVAGLLKWQFLFFVFYCGWLKGACNPNFKVAATHAWIVCFARFFRIVPLHNWPIMIWITINLAYTHRKSPIHVKNPLSGNINTTARTSKVVLIKLWRHLCKESISLARVVQGYSRDAWLADSTFPWNGEFRKLFSVIRDLKGLGDPWRTWNIHPEYFVISLLYSTVILRRRSSECLESSIESDLDMRFAI